ncbi:MAG: DUF1684 domain-containing protein [Chloroflexota bacterium]|nr:DUF1684 domain-containing protein [Chloroflexota bacterium]
MSTKTRLAGYRERRDTFFREHPNSPLTEEQKAEFEGLRYFPENPDMNLTLEIDESGEGIGEKIQFGTLSGEVKDFVRVGRIHFESNGQPVTLSVFKDTERGRYFVPFRDGTAGDESYSVGRYIDPKARPDGRLVVDFNMAYNPYCAYNTGWTCPIPPFENITKARIPAGEMDPGLLSHEEE